MKKILKQFKVVRATKRCFDWIRVLLLPIFPRKYGEALHGDKIWQHKVGELCRNNKFDVIIETGTFRGDTTLFLSKFGKVRTVEINPLYAFEARRRFNGSNIDSYIADSKEFVKAVPKNIFPLFFLDAHWGKSPLSEEINEIKNFKKAVVMIDDFPVNGLGYDEDVSPEVVRPLLENGFKVEYPYYMAPRGYCILSKI